MTRVKPAGLFAAAVLSVTLTLQAQAPSANAQRQIAGLLAEKAARNPAQRKMSSHLVHAAKILRGEPVHPDYPVPPDARAAVRVDAQNQVEVDIRANVTPELLAAIANLGGTVVNSYPQYRSLRANLPLLAVEQIAARGEVEQIRSAAQLHHGSAPARVLPNRASARRSIASQLSRFFRREPSAAPPSFGGIFRRLGSVFFVGPDTSGDIAHQANVVRANFGFDGTGVKVGVMSDGVRTLATEQTAGRLPATVNVLAAGSGPEGTALLEVVYSLAPGATLYFATANGGPAAMASNIQALADAGCNIIVDDVGYLGEGVYQDDVIAQKVNQVTAAGVFYFSAAGNGGNLAAGTSGVWEGDFVDSHTTIAALPQGGSIHSFNGVNNNTLLTTSAATFYGLSWSDPLGHSSNDYDLFVLNSTLTAVIASSTDIQDGTQDPFEGIDDSRSAIPAGSRIVILAKGTAAARALFLDTAGGMLSIGTNGAISGHPAATGAIAIAATDAHNANGGAFTGGAANPVEDFSSDGPRRVFFNPDATAITSGNLLIGTKGGTVRNKPDLTAADGVTTGVRFFGSFSFYGTSAAAPHAAAIAALVKQANPSITPAQMRSTLASASLDIQEPGFDFTSGSGIVMAPAAVAGLSGVQVTITSVPITGLTFAVTGTSCTPGAYTTPATLTWIAGATCSVQFDSPQFLNAFTQYSFTGWQNNLTGNPQTFVTPTSATTYTAVFVQGGPPVAVPVTVTSNPPGLTVQVDGAAVSTPHAFSWTTGSTHTLDAAIIQTLGGNPYIFSTWSNARPKSQSVTISAVATYTASFAAAKTGALGQVAAGGNLTTGIFVLNTGAAPASFSLQFNDNQGNPAALPFTAGSSSLLTGTLPAQGSAYYEAGNSQISTISGWGQITADPAIVIQALFRNNVNGIYYEAAVPSTSGGTEFLIPFDATTFATTGQPFVTGIAIANLDATAANVTCTAHDPNGVVIPNSVLVPALAPLGHWADFQFPALNGQRGTIECVSNTNVSATALRFLGSELSS